MGMRRATLLVVLCLVGIAGVTTVGAAGTVDGPGPVTADTPSVAGPVDGADRPPVGVQTGGRLASSHVSGCAAEPPAGHADPADGTSEVVGWVEGYWYNEPLDIAGPTLTETELDRLVRRTAARVEALRCLTFDGLPPTEMQTRDEYRTELESDFQAEVTEADRRFDNALLATTLIAGQSEDAIELQLDAQSSFPAAYYDIEADFIGFITEDADSIEIDQTTLAHELVHVLQDQHFEIESVFEASTTDAFASSLAVVEGDASLVEKQYSQNCEARAWVDSCITQPAGSLPDVPSWALTLEQLAAYNTPLAETRFDEEGWAGVNSLLENRPDSIVEALYPDRLGEFEPTLPTVEDRSTGPWERIELDNRSDDVLGQHTLTAVLMAPFYETNGATEIIDSDQFFVDPEANEISYAHPVTSGWQGDRFYGYTDGEQTAGVWELVWEDGDAAATFADAFEDLAAYRGASLAEGYENVYTFTDSEEYDMALGIEQSDDRILVVTAPTVDGLTDVHEAFDAVPAGSNGDDGTGDGSDDGTGDDTDDGTDDGSDDGTGDDTDDSTGDGTDDGTGDDTDDGSDGDGAGFGVVVVAGAVLGAVLVARWRRGGRD
jgi:hypothetical protein